MLKFKFGENWLEFNKLITHKKLLQAIKSIKKYNIKIKGKNFLDVGCGSGLFSLAAYSMGCKKVLSVDVDSDSIKSTKILKNNMKKKNLNWKVKRVSLIGENFKKECSGYDIIYCWGVAHHTGNMLKAFQNLISVCKLNSYLIIAIYNDEGLKSKIWWVIKLVFNFIPSRFKKAYAFLIMSIFRNLYVILRLIFSFQLRELYHFLRKKTKRTRGMNKEIDIMDWVGGYPYEYIKFEKLKNYFNKKGFETIKSHECKGPGNHEIVFKRKKILI